jgi:amino acid permease
MGGEAEFPRWSLARSANMVPTRLGFIYILSIVFIGLLVPQMTIAYLAALVSQQVHLSFQSLTLVSRDYLV